MGTGFLLGLYSASPVILQNVAVSCKGVLNRRARFGGSFATELAAANARLHQSPTALLHHQTGQLAHFLLFAKQNAPFHAQRLRAFSLQDLQHDPFGVLASLPVLEKDEFRDSYNNDQLRAVPQAQIVHKTLTSGTTGTPLKAGFTKHDLQKRFAFLYRMLGCYGLSPHSRTARFNGGTYFPRANKTKVFWRINHAQRQALLSSYHLHQDNAGYYIDFMKKLQPEMIDGYPSALYLLAKYLIRAGLQGAIKARVFMSTGETLEDFQKAAIREAFPQMTLLNQYASSEGAPFITQNMAGELVVNTDSGVFEFVKPGTITPAAPGEIGEMIVTSFTTHAYPLIRYRIGDTALVSDRISKTWNMPVVDAIYGRRDDLIWTPYRGWVGRLSPAIKLAPARIRETQIVQIAPDAFELHVSCADAGDLARDFAPVIAALQQRLGPVSITLRHHADPLPRGANGKLRAVIALPSARLAAQARL